jgi:kynureninase
MSALREKSEMLTGYLEYLLDTMPGERYRIITPRNPSERGCQLSIRIGGDASQRAASLKLQGAIVDFRPPDVIRVAPVPMYNSFDDVWRFARMLEKGE